MSGSYASLLLGVVVGVAACSAKTEDGPTNGVNDVLKACEIRATWTRASASECSTCIGYAKAPRCDCSYLDYAGKCNAQVVAQTSEPTCDGVGSCVDACASDCACVDACYTQRPACRTRASAVDGCVAEICDSECR